MISHIQLLILCIAATSGVAAMGGIPDFKENMRRAHGRPGVPVRRYTIEQLLALGAPSRNLNRQNNTPAHPQCNPHVKEKKD